MTLVRTVRTRQHWPTRITSRVLSDSIAVADGNTATYVPGGGESGVFFQPDIGTLANGNTLVSSGVFNDVNRDHNGDAVVQSTVTRPGGQSKCIEMSYVEDESQATLSVYGSAGLFTPTASLYCRKWEMFSAGWSDNWPVGFKTARYFSTNNGTAPNDAYMSEKFIWQRYTDAGGSRNDPVWGLNHAINEDIIEQYSAPRIIAGQWHKFETWITMNSALDVEDGIMRCWIDDELVLDQLVAYRRTGTAENGTQWQSMWFGGNCSFSPLSNGWEFPTGQTLYRYLDSPYLSSTLDR